MITIHIDVQVLAIISLKALIKYINMQPDRPLRSPIIFRKLARIMENFIIRFSGAKLWNAIKEDLKSASRSVRFKKLLKESVISKY